MSKRVYQPDANNVVCVDAENAHRVPGDRVRWIEKADFGVPSGTYMTPTGRTMDRTQAGQLLFKFNITSPGIYQFLARCHTHGVGAWMWVDIDGNRRHFGPKAIGRLVYPGAAFTWGDGTLGNYNTVPAEVELSVGIHTLRLTSIGGHLKVDRIALIPAGSNAITHGSAAAGPAESSHDSGEQSIVEDNYQSWLLNPIYNNSRVLLVELAHADGVVRLASRPLLDNYHQAWDDWLIADPELDDEITGAASIGDIEAINPEASENWLNNEWLGHSCKWLFGDEAWPIDQYRMIASATIDGCRQIGERRYRFDLSGDVQRFNRTFHTGGDVTKSLTLEAGIAWVLGYYEEPVTPNYLNLDESDLDMAMTFEVTESSNMYELLDLLARSVGAHLRVSQNGELDIVRPDTQHDASFYLTPDDIVRGRIRMSEIVPAVSKVVVNFNRGQGSVESPTTASTGKYQDTLEIETAHANQSDAQAFADARAVYRAVTHHLWEIEVVGAADFMQVADYVGVDHPELVGAGVTQRIRRTPLSQRAIVEVLV